MPQQQLRTFPQILQRLVARIVARSALSDLTEASAVRHILAAVARELDDGYYQIARVTDAFSIDRATGFDLDERARDIQPGTLRRIGPVNAQGQQIFSRATNTGTTLTIAAGTAVKRADGTVARTTQEAVITNISPEQITGHGVGRDSNAVAVTAAEAGAAGNAAIGAYDRFVNRPTGVVETTNTAAFVNGRDTESDDDFRARLRSFVASLARCTPEALAFAVIGTQNPLPNTTNQVLFSHVFVDPVQRGNVTLYIDDGAGTARTVATVANENVTTGLAGPPANTAVGGEEFLNLDNAPIDPDQPITVTRTPSGSPAVTLVQNTDYFLNPANGQIFFTSALSAADVITASYTYYTGLIAEVQKVVDGDPNDRADFPGFRAAGVRVLVREPTVVNITVEATITLLEGFDFALTSTAVESAITDYINQLGISADVIRNEIIERIMGVDGVLDVGLVTPAENVVVLDNEIPRTSTASITIT